MFSFALFIFPLNLLLCSFQFDFGPVAMFEIGVGGAYCFCDVCASVRACVLMLGITSEPRMPGCQDAMILKFHIWISEIADTFFPSRLCTFSE